MYLSSTVIDSWLIELLYNLLSHLSFFLTLYCQLQLNSFIDVYLCFFLNGLYTCCSFRYFGFHRLKTLKILWLSCWIYTVIVIIVRQQFNLLQMGTNLGNRYSHSSFRCYLIGLFGCLLIGLADCFVTHSNDRS